MPDSGQSFQDASSMLYFQVFDWSTKNGRSHDPKFMGYSLSHAQSCAYCGCEIGATLSIDIPLDDSQQVLQWIYIAGISPIFTGIISIANSWIEGTYPLVKVYIANWRNHHLEEVFLNELHGPFSIAMLNYQTVTKDYQCCLVVSTPLKKYERQL